MPAFSPFPTMFSKGFLHTVLEKSVLCYKDLKVAFQFLGRKFYKNTEISSLFEGHDYEVAQFFTQNLRDHSSLEQCHGMQLTRSMCAVPWLFSTHGFIHYSKI